MKIGATFERGDSTLLTSCACIIVLCVGAFKILDYREAAAHAASNRALIERQLAQMGYQDDESLVTQERIDHEGQKPAAARPAAIEANPPPAAFAAE